MKKRDIITIIVLGIIFCIIFLIAYINKDNNNGVENSFEAKLNLLTEENTFLSVSNNINKLFEYSTNDTLLRFITKDEINKQDYQNKSFEAEEIYVVNKNNLYKYYVKGNVYLVTEESSSEFIRKEYFVLNYDKSNKCFSIDLISENAYENAKKEKYIFETINKNNYNEFEYTYLSDKSRALMYFNDFLYKVYTNKKEAYNLVSNDTKEQYFNTYEEFEKFIKNHNNIIVKEYSVNGNEIGIKDNYNVEYVFEISYILNYNVTINITEE